MKRTKTLEKKRLTLSVEKLRELQKHRLTDNDLARVAGGQGCDCSSAMCDGRNP